MATIARCASVQTACVARASRVSVRPVAFQGARLAGRNVVASKKIESSPVVPKVSAVEIAQVADEASFIAGTAFTMMAITLVGLAVGFVLLRVESLVEEGKL